MSRHRTHSAAFERQVVQEYLAGETLQALGRRHDFSRNLIRIWLLKHEAGAFDEDAVAADMVQEYEARIAALERLVGKRDCQEFRVRLGQDGTKGDDPWPDTSSP